VRVVHDNLKTVANICFLFGSYVDWRTISNEFVYHDHRSKLRSFSEVSRSLGKVRALRVADGEIPSPYVASAIK